jgi:hypothetical protein
MKHPERIVLFLLTLACAVLLAEGVALALGERVALGGKLIGTAGLLGEIAGLMQLRVSEFWRSWVDRFADGERFPHGPPSAVTRNHVKRGPSGAQHGPLSAVLLSAPHRLLDDRCRDRATSAGLVGPVNRDGGEHRTPLKGGVRVRSRTHPHRCSRMFVSVRLFPEGDRDTTASTLARLLFSSVRCDSVTTAREHKTEITSAVFVVESKGNIAVLAVPEYVRSILPTTGPIKGAWR